MSSLLDHLLRDLDETDTMTYIGRVSKVVGMTIEGVLPKARIGAICRLEPAAGPPISAQVVGLRDNSAILMPMAPLAGLSVGTRIVMTAKEPHIKVGRGCLGRVLNGLGEPIDGKGPLNPVEDYPLTARPINPLRRRGITKPLDLGVRAINALLTCGEGQRIAVVSPAGVGKSTLLGMMARHTQADIAVVALIGERGREVQEFVERDLKLTSIAADRIVVVAATSDEPPAMRIRGAFTATAIAEYFRDQGHQVLLMMDSVTRAVTAQREIGLSVGEPPATRGYPPSAFAIIPNLLERAGATDMGSITGIYTTLLETDDIKDPIGEAVRATTDGHILLSQDLAERGQFPAIDVPKSISRVIRNITEPAHQEAILECRSLIRDFREAEDLVNIGAYKAGSNPAYDRALANAGKVREFLTQTPDEAVSMEDSINQLNTLLSKATDESRASKFPRVKTTSQRRASAAHQQNKRGV